MEVSFNGDFYFFKFTNNEDRDAAMEAGPFKMAEKLMIVKSWTEDLKSMKRGISNIPVWIQLFNIPACMWSREGISLIASVVGKPIKFDRATATRTRLTYAAVCVEVKPDKDLPTSIKLYVGRTEGDFKEVIVEYPWKPLICSDCCSFGHPKGQCMEDVEAKVRDQKEKIEAKRKAYVNRDKKKNSVPNNPHSSHSEEEERQEIRRKSRSSKNPKPTKKKDNNEHVNPFTALSTEMAEEVAPGHNLQANIVAPTTSKPNEKSVQLPAPSSPAPQIQNTNVSISTPIPVNPYPDQRIVVHNDPTP